MPEARHWIVLPSAGGQTLSISYDLSIIYFEMNKCNEVWDLASSSIHLITIQCRKPGTGLYYPAPEARHWVFTMTCHVVFDFEIFIPIKCPGIMKNVTSDQQSIICVFGLCQTNSFTSREAGETLNMQLLWEIQGAILRTASCIFTKGAQRHPAKRSSS